MLPQIDFPLSLFAFGIWIHLSHWHIRVFLHITAACESAKNVNAWGIRSSHCQLTWFKKCWHFKWLFEITMVSFWALRQSQLQSSWVPVRQQSRSISAQRRGRSENRISATKALHSASSVAASISVAVKAHHCLAAAKMWAQKGTITASGCSVLPVERGVGSLIQKQLMTVGSSQSF